MVTKGRSPNYPAVGLEAAIASAKALYGKSGKATVSPEAAVMDMGFRSMNGPARSRLSALRKYGLIEETKSGVRVTDRALTLFHPQADAEGYRQAIRDAATAPALFRELMAAPVPSDDALRLSLLKRGFGASGANLFIQAFRDTQKLVNDVFQGYDSPNVQANGSGSPARPDQPMIEQPVRQPGMRAVQVPLSAKTWATLQAAFPLTEEAWDQLLAVLKVMKPGLVIDTGSGEKSD
jgi:hypothetical protein